MGAHYSRIQRLFAGDIDFKVIPRDYERLAPASSFFATGSREAYAGRIRCGDGGEDDDDAYADGHDGKDEGGGCGVDAT